MKKKNGIKLILCSLLVGLGALTACGSGNKASSVAPVDSSTKPAETSTSSLPAQSSNTATPSSSEASSSTPTVQLPEYVGVKLYVNGVETVLTSPRVELEYGTDYLDSIVIKAVKADGTEVDVTSELTITTEIDENSNAGNYTATITYGNFPALTVNVVIKKADIEVRTFNVTSKVEDGTPCLVQYELSNGATPKFYYKAKGAEDSTYSETAPVEVGEYVCKLVVEESTNYNAVEETTEFTITEDIREIKAFIGDNEVSATNNTIEFAYNDGYDIKSKLVVKDITGGAETVITDYTVETNLTDASVIGNYSAKIKYGKSNEISINIVVNKADIEAKYDIKSKVFDGKEIEVGYELPINIEATMYFKKLDADDDTYSEDVPAAVGEYICKLVSDNYNITNTKQFFISKRALVIPTADHGSTDKFSMENEHFRFQDIVTGELRTLVIPGFDSKYMELYQEVEGEYVKVDNITGTSGTINFKIALTSDSVYFETMYPHIREINYTYELIDMGSIITKYSISGTDYEIAKLPVFSGLPCEQGNYSFTCVSGYRAYFCDYDGYEGGLYADGKYRFFVVKQGSYIIFKQRIGVISDCVKAVEINGEESSIGYQTIRYNVKSTDEEVNIRFIDFNSNLIYELDNSHSMSRGTVPDNGIVTLSAENHKLSLWRKLDSSSSRKICDIMIVKDEPVKSLEAIRYDIGNNSIFVQNIEDDGDNLLDSNSDNDFIIGFNVTLNEGYDDCEVRIIDRDYGGEPDFISNLAAMRNGYYVRVQVLRNNKVIYSRDVDCVNDFVSLKDAITSENRGIESSILLVTNADKKATFSLIGEDVDATLLVNGEEENEITYESDGIYKERITFSKELYGEIYAVEFDCIVIVSENSQDFGWIECTYKEQYGDGSVSNYGANIYDSSSYKTNNTFSGRFSFYSVENFDEDSVKTDKTGYTIKDVELVNDDEIGLTYMIVTINDSTSDHILYLFVPTDNTLGDSLDIEGNQMGVYSGIYGRITLKHDDEYVFNFTNATTDDYYEFEFVSGVELVIDGPNNYHKDCGFDDNFEVMFTESGTYKLTVTNRFDAKRVYTLNVELSNLVDILIDDEVVASYNDKKPFNMTIKIEDMKIVGYLGEANQSLIENDKVTITIGGGCLSVAYYDKECTKEITNSDVTFDVLYDANNTPYVVFYCMFDSDLMPIELYFADRPESILNIKVGNDEYELGTKDYAGDLKSLAGLFGEDIYLLEINNPADTITIVGKEVYDDYSYAVVLGTADLLEQISTVSELDALNKIYRITDTETLSLDIESKLGMMFYMYVLPEGTTGDTKFNELDPDDVLTIMVFKACTIFNIQIDEENYYATIFASMLSRQVECKDNSFDSEKNGYGTYTSLEYYIGFAERENITSDNKYVLTINSGFDLSNALYTDSAKETPIAIDNQNQITLDVKDSSGIKYVEFYYDLGQTAGSATVKLYLSNPKAFIVI